MAENDFIRIIRPNYIISLRGRNVFDEEGTKVPLGPKYALITTSRGNIAIKNVKDFAENVSKIASGKEVRVFGKEALLEVKKRLEFDENGKKVPKGSPYVWITTTKFSISVDLNDIKVFAKDMIEILKFL